MHTKVYSELNRYGSKQWWWCEVGNNNPSHGPFPTRDEARDAASAARKTANYEKEMSDTLSILSAG